MEGLDYINSHFLLGLALISAVFCLFYYSAARKQNQAMGKLDALLKQLESVNHHMKSVLQEQRSCNRLLVEGSGGYASFSSPELYASSDSEPAVRSVTLNGMDSNTANNKLYVGNIDYSATESELESHFSQYGQIEFVNIPVNRYNGRARGFGFVTFSSQQDAQRAMALDGSDFKGRQLQVNFAKERDPT